MHVGFVSILLFGLGAAVVGCRTHRNQLRSKTFAERIRNKLSR